jgi:DNA-binding NarL/FixJ family response regulator
MGVAAILRCGKPHHGGLPTVWCLGHTGVTIPYAVPPSIVIVDDHAGFRSCARRLLETEGYRVVGEAADGGSGLSSARRLKPELMLIDVCLPDIDGFELAAQLQELEPCPTVILTSSRDCAELESLTGGCACGVVPKDQLSGAVLEQLLARA